MNSIHTHFVNIDDKLYIDIKVNFQHNFTHTFIWYETDDISIHQMLRLFKPIVHDNVIIYYWAHLKNNKLFKLVIGMLDLDLSFSLMICQNCTRRIDFRLSWSLQWCKCIIVCLGCYRRLLSETHQNTHWLLDLICYIQFINCWEHFVFQRLNKVCHEDYVILL